MPKKTSVPPYKLALYERLLEAAGDLVGKSNFGSAYTAINGNMYSMISKHGVVGIRLPDDERAAFSGQVPDDDLPRRSRLASGQGVRRRSGGTPRPNGGAGAVPLLSVSATPHR